MHKQLCITHEHQEYSRVNTGISTNVTTQFQFTDPDLQRIYELGKQQAELLAEQAKWQIEQDELARRTHILHMWQPYIDALYSSLPEAISPYVVLPTLSRCVVDAESTYAHRSKTDAVRYAPVYIKVPRCAMIAAWIVDEETAGDLFIGFEVCQTTAGTGGEPVEAPKQPRRPASYVWEHFTPTFHVAFYNARNLYEANQAAFIEQVRVPSPATLDDLDFLLQRIARATEDTAAVLLNLDKVIETINESNNLVESAAIWGS